jgi:hypothetical protein
MARSIGRRLACEAPREAPCRRERSHEIERWEASRLQIEEVESLEAAQGSRARDDGALELWGSFSPSLCLSRVWCAMCA